MHIKSEIDTHAQGTASLEYKYNVGVNVSKGIPASFLSISWVLRTALLSDIDSVLVDADEW